MRTLYTIIFGKKILLFFFNWKLIFEKVYLKKITLPLSPYLPHATAAEIIKFKKACQPTLPNLKFKGRKAYKKQLGTLFLLHFCFWMQFFGDCLFYYSRKWTKHIQNTWITYFNWNNMSKVIKNKILIVIFMLYVLWISCFETEPGLSYYPDMSESQESPRLMKDIWWNS